MQRTMTEPMGDGTYRTLSYAFRVRWDSDAVGAYVRSVFGRFAVPPARVVRRAGDVPDYVFDSTPGAHRLRLLGETLAESRDIRDLLHHLSWHVNTAATRTCTDLLLVHAGAVVTPSGSGVMLPGVSGAGKTSLVAGLVSAGWGYLSDEAGAIDPVTRELCPYPKALSIKPGMFEGFVDLLDPDQPWPISSREWLIAPEALRPDPVADRSAVDLIVFLEHAPDVPMHVTPLSPARSVTALFEHISNPQAWGARALTLLAAVVRGARSYALQTSRTEDAVRSVLELAARDA